MSLPDFCDRRHAAHLLHGPVLQPHGLGLAAVPLWHLPGTQDRRMLQACLAVLQRYCPPGGCVALTCSVASPGGGVGSGVGVDDRVAVPRLQAGAPAPGDSHNCSQRGRQQQHLQWRAAIVKRYSIAVHAVEGLVSNAVISSVLAGCVPPHVHTEMLSKCTSQKLATMRGCTVASKHACLGAGARMRTLLNCCALMCSLATS